MAFSMDLKHRQSLVSFAAMAMLGFVIGVIGPTLHLIADNTDTPLVDAGSYFSVRGAGWIAGCIIWAALNVFSGNKGHVFLAGALLSGVFYINMTPFITSFPLVLGFTFLASFAMSLIDIGTNTLVFLIWGAGVAPYMQFLHFCFGVGATMSPALVALVLAFTDDGTKQLFFSFWLCGLVCLALTLPSIFIPAPSAASEDKEDDKGAITLPPVAMWVLCIVMGLAMLIYVGGETGYGGWVFTYAVQAYGFSEVQAANLSSFFWLFLTAGRLLAVPAATKLSNRSLLLICLGGYVLTALAMVLLEPFRIKAVLWLLTGSLGLSMSAIYASTFSLPADMGVKVTGRAASVFIVGGSVGEMLLPAVIGWLMLRLGVSYLAYCILFIGVSLTLLVLYLVFVFRLNFHVPTPAAAKAEAARDEIGQVPLVGSVRLEEAIEEDAGL